MPPAPTAAERYRARHGTRERVTPFLGVQTRGQWSARRFRSLEVKPDPLADDG